MSFQFTTTVTILGSKQQVGVDKGNRAQYAQSEVESPGWVLWPQSSTEATDAEDITTDVLEGFAPVGTSLDSIQQVRVPFTGKTYEVQGSAWSWQSPFTGRTPGVAVTLKAMT